MTDEELDRLESRALAQIPAQPDVLALVTEVRRLRAENERLARRRGFAPVYVVEPEDR